jgi:hypothetical protein
MDPFQQFATWDETTALRWATGLDQRTADPQQVAVRAGILAAAALRPGQVAVEVGCGTGPLLAGLAEAVGPSGRVLGVEPQSMLARIAARRPSRRRPRPAFAAGVGRRWRRLGRVRPPARSATTPAGRSLRTSRWVGSSSNRSRSRPPG